MVLMDFEWLFDGFWMNSDGCWMDFDRFWMDVGWF